RPLAEVPGERTTDLSRKHLVHTEVDSGVITIIGGKLTTYRKMAEDTVDAAVQSAALPAGGARTTRLPLFGAAPRSALPSVEAPPRLVAKYGTEAPRVAALGEVDPALARPLFPACDITVAEVVW